MILAVKEILILAQCNITAVFAHTTMSKGEDVYVHQPRGFNRGSKVVLRLQLERQGLKPSELDPCLVMSDTLIVIIYVDDELVYARDSGDIDDLIK